MPGLAVTEHGEIGDDILVEYGGAVIDGITEFGRVILFQIVVLPAVTTNPATAISHLSAISNGFLDDDGGEACQCGFEWGLTDAYGMTTPTQSRVTGQTFSQAIHGLFPGFTYHFRAFATNSAGTGYGDDMSFTTTPSFNRAHALSREEL